MRPHPFTALFWCHCFQLFAQGGTLLRRKVAVLFEFGARAFTLFWRHLRPAALALLCALPLLWRHSLPALRVLQHFRALSWICVPTFSHYDHQCLALRLRQSFPLGGLRNVLRRLW